MAQQAIVLLANYGDGQNLERSAGGARDARTGFQKGCWLWRRGERRELGAAGQRPCKMRHGCRTAN